MIEQWKSVFWTDEWKFQIVESKRRAFVRRSKEKQASNICPVPTVKYKGGSVMVCKFFDGGRSVYTIRTEGILKHVAKPEAQYFRYERFY